MYERCATMIVQALEPLHVGSAAGSRRVDLPAARDPSSNDPLLTFSALRGMLADACDSTVELETLLGDRPRPATSAAPAGDRPPRRGAVAFTDAHPLLLPVRSARGGFAWATSFRALDGFARALTTSSASGNPGPAAPPPPSLPDRDRVILPVGSPLGFGSPGRVVLASRSFEASAHESLATWLAERLKSLDIDGHEVQARLAVVPDSVFTFLLETETEERHRVKVESGTVKAGALFSLEVVPRDTVFFGHVLAMSPSLYRDVRDDLATAEAVERRVRERLGRRPLTIGGEITVGMGRCKARLI